MEKTQEVSTTETPEVNELQGVLDPIHKMATFFLESVVQSPSLADLNETEDLSTIESVLTSAESHWQTWLRHYSSYVVCLAVAAVYILLLPVVGCTIAACRSRGRCIGRPRTGRRSQASRRWCTGLLLVMCMALLFGVVGMFVANQQVHEQTRPDGLPAVLQLNVKRFNNYLQQTKTEYSDYECQLTSALGDLQTKVKAFPAEVQDRVGDETKLGPLFVKLKDCLTRLNQTESFLTQLDDVVSNVSAKIDSLSASLIEVKADADVILSTCDGSLCRQLADVTSSLRTVANFSDVGGVTSDDLINYLHGDSNIDENLAASNHTYNTVGRRVAELSIPTLTALLGKNESVLDEVESMLNRTLQKLDDLSLGSGVVGFIDDELSPRLQTYGDHVYYVGLALSWLVLLVVVLCHVGLAYGACGTTDVESTECCKKVKARPALKASLVVVFLVASVVMLAVSVLFPVGGIVYSDLCRNLLVPPPDPRAAAVVDNILSSVLELPIGLLELQQSCVDGQTVYTLLSRLEVDHSLTEKLTVESFNISVEVDRLKSARYLNSTLNAISDGLASNLYTLTSLTKTLNFTSFERQLANPLTSVDLVVYARNLSLLGIEYANNVTAVYQQQYLPALEAVTALKDNIVKVKRLTSDLDTAQVLLEEARQKPITPDAATAAATVAADRLLDDYVSFFCDVNASIQARLASCDVVASLIAGCRDALCRQLLGPYNAFWFSAAWCLAFFVVLIPNVLILTDKIRTVIPGHRPSVRAPSLTSIERLNIEKWVATVGFSPEDEGRSVNNGRLPANAEARPSPASPSKGERRRHHEPQDAGRDHLPVFRHWTGSSSNQRRLPRQGPPTYHSSRSRDPRRTNAL